MPILIVQCLWEVVHDIGVNKVWEFLDCASCELFKVGVDVCDVLVRLFKAVVTSEICSL